MGHDLRNDAFRPRRALTGRFFPSRLVRFRRRGARCCDAVPSNGARGQCGQAEAGMADLLPCRCTGRANSGLISTWRRVGPENRLLAGVPVIPFGQQFFARDARPPPLEVICTRVRPPRMGSTQPSYIQIRRDFLKALAPKSQKALVPGGCCICARRTMPRLWSGADLRPASGPATFGASKWRSGWSASAMPLTRSTMPVRSAAPVARRARSARSAGWGRPIRLFCDFAAARWRRASAPHLTSPLPRHARRGGLARLGRLLCGQVLSAVFAHMAGISRHLASTEVGEIAEPHQPGRGGSSAMPHKRNPVSCTVILAASHQARGLADAFDEAPIGAHERPAGAWHGSGTCCPRSSALASGALREARVLAEGIGDRRHAHARPTSTRHAACLR